MDQTLYHHGILGQEWGVRNGPPYPLGYKAHSSEEKKKNSKSSLNNYGNAKSFNSGTNSTEKKTKSSLSDEQKARIKRDLVVAAAAVGIGAACYFAYKKGVLTKLSKYDLSKMSKAQIDDVAKQAFSSTLDDVDDIMASMSDPDKKILIKAGQDMHRVSSYKELDLVKAAQKGTYVSVTESDRAAYLAYLRDWHQTGERYELTLKAAKDIIVPSDEAARKIFEEFWSANPDYQTELFKTIANAYYKLGVDQGLLSIMSKTELHDSVVEQAIHAIETDKFKTAMYSIVKGQTDSQKLISHYKSLGYDAIIDYFDKGTMATYPAILFDASEAVSSITSKKLSYGSKMAAKILLSKYESHPFASEAAMESSLFKKTSEVFKKSTIEEVEAWLRNKGYA